MGWGYPPFYLPDPREPKEVRDAIAMSAFLNVVSGGLYLREVFRAAPRAASHRIAATGGSRMAMFRLGMAETSWPTVMRGVGLVTTPAVVAVAVATAAAVGYVATADVHGAAAPNSINFGLSPSMGGFDDWPQSWGELFGSFW